MQTGYSEAPETHGGNLPTQSGLSMPLLQHYCHGPPAEERFSGLSRACWCTSDLRWPVHVK